MKNNLLKIALSLGMIVAVSGMQADASQKVTEISKAENDSSNQDKTSFMLNTDKNFVPSNETINIINNDSNNKIGSNIRRIKRKKVHNNNNLMTLQNEQAQEVVGLEDYNEKYAEKLSGNSKKVKNLFNSGSKESYLDKYSPQFEVDEPTQKMIRTYVDVQNSEYLKKLGCDYDVVTKTASNMSSLQKHIGALLKSTDFQDISNKCNLADNILLTLSRVTGTLQSIDSKQNKNRAPIQQMDDTYSVISRLYTNFSAQYSKVSKECAKYSDLINKEDEELKRKIEELRRESKENMNMWQVQMNNAVNAKQALEEIKDKYYQAYEDENLLDAKTGIFTQYRSAFSYLKKYGTTFSNNVDLLKQRREQLLNDQTSKQLSQNDANQTSNFDLSDLRTAQQNKKYNSENNKVVIAEEEYENEPQYLSDLTKSGFVEIGTELVPSGLTLQSGETFYAKTQDDKFVEGYIVNNDSSVTARVNFDTDGKVVSIEYYEEEDNEEEEK